MSYSPLIPLDGRVAIVTGGARGIGLETAKALKENGARIVIVDINAEVGEKAAKELDADFVGTDLSRSDEVNKLATEVRSKHGRIDIAVNNAGIAINAPSEECSDEDWHKVININLHAVFYCCREFGKVMLEQGKGSIINTASIQSFDPSENLIAYASTKAAIGSFTRSLASFAIKQGERVNAVVPGPVWTPLIPSTMPKEKVKQFGSQTVFGRAAQPAELAPIFVFLASDQASYVTGEVYGATGGQMPM